MRRGEVLGLAWEDVDLIAARLSVTWTLGVVGAKPTWKRQPKSRAGQLTMALHPAQRAGLQGLSVHPKHRRGLRPEATAADLLDRAFARTGIDQLW